MNANTSMPVVLSDEQIQHKGTVQGVVVSRVQKIQMPDGSIQTVKFWSDMQTGKLVRVD